MICLNLGQIPLNPHYQTISLMTEIIVLKKIKKIKSVDIQTRAMIVEYGSTLYLHDLFHQVSIALDSLFTEIMHVFMW